MKTEPTRAQPAMTAEEIERAERRLDELWDALVRDVNRQVREDREAWQRGRSAMGWLIGLGVVLLGAVIVRVVRTAPPGEKLWPSPLDPRERAMSVERLNVIRENQGA